MGDTKGMRTMFIMVTCMDKDGPNPAIERKKHLMEHLGYIDTILDQILVAGPIYADDNTTLIGSHFLYKTESKKQAKEWLEADPYFKADFWKSVEVRIFRGAAGDAVGGKTY